MVVFGFQSFCILYFSIFITAHVVLSSVSQNACPVEAFVDLSLETTKNDISKGFIINGTNYTSEAIQVRNYTIFGCPCMSRPCIPMCCPSSLLFRNGQCLPSNRTNLISFPPMFDSENFTMLNNSLNEQDYHIFVWNPCSRYKSYNDNKERRTFKLTPTTVKTQAYQFLNNGTIYKTHTKEKLDYNDYCFGEILLTENEYSVVFCETVKKSTHLVKVKRVGVLISVGFLLMTLMVYIILPELRNIHGQILCCYIICLAIAYANLGISNFLSSTAITKLWCRCSGELNNVIVIRVQ